MSTIAVIGMPNTGKSTLFNRLTGHHAHIGNWPGLTVELMQAGLELSGRTLQLVDLPGIYDLRGHSEDEAVVRRYLERTPVDLVLVVLNASQLDRQLRLALQVQRLGLPALVLLNMADEASRFGVRINTEALSAALKLPVQLLSAKYRQGIDSLKHSLVHQLEASEEQAEAVQQLEPRLAAVDAELDTAMAALVERSVTLPSRWRDQRTRRLDAVLLHPLLGLPLFFLAMALMFQAIYAIGVPVQEGLAGLLDQFGQLVLKPFLAPLPSLLQGFLLEGLYQGLGTVMAFLKQFFGDLPVRFRASYFPFTEPSAEVDVQWRGRWLEVMGCGMVDPAVLEGLGIDSERWSGFAAGLGVERFCMVRHGIDDIRRLYTSDLRFLEQF